MLWFLRVLLMPDALSGLPRASSAQSPNLASILTFEAEHFAGAPGGWCVIPAGSV